MQPKATDTRTLADLTALQAREGDCAQAIAKVTDLAEEEVRRRLERGVGKRRVWRVFEEEWPARDSDEVLAARGGMTAAVAREENYAAQVAKITGLTEEAVRARVAGAHPWKRMRSVFSVEWPPGIAARGRMTIEDASMSVALEDAIATITGLTWDVVTDRLSQADANTLVHDVFRDEWPEKHLVVAEGAREEIDDEAWYGRLRCSVVRGANRAARIAKDLRLSEAQVAYERFNADITLLVHETQIEAVRKMVPGRIAGRLNLITIEACLDCGHDSLRLAMVLKLDVGDHR